MARRAPDVELDDGVVSIPNTTGGTISSFSSFGLNAELTLKPDIGAPGGLIRSTYPLEPARTRRSAARRWPRRT